MVCQVFHAIRITGPRDVGLADTPIHVGNDKV